MPAQNAVADRVKCAAPERRNIAAEQIGHTPHHFSCRFVREREQQDAVGGNALFQQEGHPISEGACFARAGSGDDQGRSGGRGDSGVLLWIQFARIVDLEIDRRTKRLQHVVGRHARDSKDKSENAKAKRHPEAWPEG